LVQRILELEDDVEERDVLARYNAEIAKRIKSGEIKG
jgi:hypothetical protein